MNTARVALCAASLFALVASSEVHAADALCWKNHYILDPGCVPPNFLIPPVPAGVNHWTAIGPDGANVAALVIDPVIPSTAFAGTLGSGVLKTTDGGASWASANVGLPTTNVLALAIDRAASATLYAGTDAGVFKSIDGGRSWVIASAGLDGTSQLTVNVLAIDPMSPSTVYALTAGGLFKTTNGAASWTSLNAGLSRYTTRLIAIDPTSPSTVYIGVDDTTDDSHNGVLKSTDGGASWTQIYTVACEQAFSCVDGWPEVVALAIDAHSRLYLATSCCTVATSSDGGATWSANRPPADDIVSSLAVDPASSTTLYATTFFRGSFFRSTDAGKTWTPVADGALASVFIKVIAMAASTPATIYAGGSTGIYRSSDGAQTWTRLTLSVRTVGVYPLAVDPGASSMIYAGTGSGIMKTTDGGARWADSNAGLPDRWINKLAIDPVSPSTVYAVRSPPYSLASVIYKSTDGGAHWTPPSNVVFTNQLRALAIAPTQPSTLFAGVNVEGVFKSTDGGASWAHASSGLTALQPTVSALAVDPTTADTVYAATDPTGMPDTPAKIFKSTDGAAHWNEMPIGVAFNTEITSVVVDRAAPSTLYAVYTDFDQAGVFKSSDGGETWVVASQNLPPTAWVVLTIDPNSPSHVYAATSAGVFMSTDGAASWTPINAGLPNVGVSDVAIDRTGSVLRAATIAGLFEYDLSRSSSSSAAPVIEYYHAGFDHYFMTALPNEIAALDSGTISGWVRTGFQFNTLAAQTSGASSVCRFNSTAFGGKSSHFYSPFASECMKVQANSDWLLETGAAFYIGIPANDGSCAAGLTPIYRLYNDGQGGAPNHRYTTDLSVRAQMLAQGWTPEGFGPNAVQMCSPP